MADVADYFSLPVRDFLDRIAAKTASPGGGSVAASAGALAVAMARMVLEFTVGRKTLAAHVPQLRAVLEELRRASDLFAELLNEDIAAYDRYVQARRTTDPAEQERAVATAIAVPMEIAAVAEAVVARLDDVKTFVSLALYSDVEVAAILAHATAEAAGRTVAGNLPYLENKGAAGQLGTELDGILSRAQKHREAILAYRPTGG